MDKNIDKTILSFPIPQKGSPNLEPLCLHSPNGCDVIAVIDEWGMQEYLKEIFDFKKPKSSNEKYFWETTEYCRFRFVDFFQSIVKDLFQTNQPLISSARFGFIPRFPITKKKNK
ncbi:hypothetical protein HC823_00990 [Candidatus Gracilibacteria bacterium]|nr:hypothetical protein [Candidatus Gracilibacteria bacterium]